MATLRDRLEQAQDDLAALYELYHRVAQKKRTIQDSLGQLAMLDEGCSLLHHHQQSSDQ